MSEGSFEEGAFGEVYNSEGAFFGKVCNFDGKLRLAACGKVDVKVEASEREKPISNGVRACEGWL